MAARQKGETGKAELQVESQVGTLLASPKHLFGEPLFTKSYTVNF